MFYFFKNKGRYMYAVIRTGGKQYRVKEGDVLEIDKLGAEKGRKVSFDQVLLIEEEGRVLVGTPIVENAVVRAEVLENMRGDKVLIFKKKRRKQYRRTRSHRQELTKVRIEKIHPDATLLPREEPKVEAPPGPASRAEGCTRREESAEAGRHESGEAQKNGRTEDLT